MTQTLQFPLERSSAPGISTVFADSAYPKAWGFHTGWDANYYRRDGRPVAGDGDLGMPFGAVADGVVRFVSNDAGGLWGGLIVVWHPAYGIYSRYGHDLLARDLVQVGQQVEMGQRLGLIGKGKAGAFTAHLHFDFAVGYPEVGGQPHYPYWPGSDKAGLLRYFLDPSDVYQKFGIWTPPVPNGRRMFRDAF